MSTLPEKEEEMLRRLNVDDLPQTGLQVKVVYLNPSGNVIVRIPGDDPTKTLVETGVKCLMRYYSTLNLLLNQETTSAKVYPRNSVNI